MALYRPPNLDGRIAAVTGANSGIGFWTALGLANAGAHVVMVCRDAERGGKARAAIARASGKTPDLVLADFADLDAVRSAAAKIAEAYPAVHVLVNNAGLFSRNREATRDGYEMTFAVNHLAPFLFTNSLLPALEKAGEPGRAARIVVVASAAARRASIDLEDLMSSRRGYSMFGQYGASKLANILFTKELARRLPPRPVTVNCLHPGVVATEIGNKGGVAGLVWSGLKPFLTTSEQGAVNSLYVATAPEIEGVSGSYFEKMRAVSPNPIANDPRIAQLLWAESGRLINAALEERRAA